MSSQWMTTGTYPVREDRGTSAKAVIILAVSFTLIYLMTLAQNLQGGDSGEFIVIAHRGGVAHPPGYPLYGLLGRAFSWLPFDNPATSVSLLSALGGVLAVVFGYLALRRWDIGVHVAWVCAGFFGLSPVFWRYSGVAEVFSLGAALGAFLLWTTGRSNGPRGLVRAGLMGLALGLGLSNHHTIVLLFPFLITGLIRACREVQRRSWLILPVFVLSLAIGLAPYLTLLEQGPGTGWRWGGPMGLSGLIGHFLRKDYGTFNLGLGHTPPHILENPLAYLAHLPRSFTLLLPVGIAGIAVAAGSLRGVRHRLATALDAASLLVSFFLAAILFPAGWNLSPEEAGFIIERFYILPDLLFTVACAVGLERLVLWQPRIKLYLREVAIGVLCALVLLNIEQADWSNDTAVEDYVFNALDTVRPGSVVVGTGDLSLFGFLAACEVFAYRTDVVYLDLNLIRTRWYHQRLQALLGKCDLPFDEQHTPVVEIVQCLLAYHPVYLAGDQVPTSMIEQFNLYPVGPLLAVLPKETSPPLLPQVEQINRTLFGRMRRRTTCFAGWNAWGQMAGALYARTWNDIASNYERMGHSTHADTVRSMAAQYTLCE